MLIEFRVKNFRSLRDEQVLSLVASKDKTLQDTHTVATGLSAAPHLLRSAVIYGANASGKSNLIKALGFMQGVVLQSASLAPGQVLDVRPFLLDSAFAGAPTAFEVTFVRDGARYQYGFALTGQRVVEEHLLVYKAFKPQRWFERRFDAASGKDVYAFGAGLKGAKTVWEEATRPNALFLSMAVQLNSDALRPVFDWFATGLVIVNEHTRFGPQFSITRLQQAEGRKRICNFLAAADISIADIEVVKRQRDAQQALPLDVELTQQDLFPAGWETPQLRFHHVTDRGQAVFELADESGGTRNLLALAGPVLDILEKGRTLVIDELDTSLHTLLVRELVRLFHRPQPDPDGAQLIFTTHDTSLLDAPLLLRRDQVWLMEKDRDQASRLVGLAEFSPRKNEALERGYLMGRYGGVPFLRNDLGTTH